MHRECLVRGEGVAALPSDNAAAFLQPVLLSLARARNPPLVGGGGNLLSPPDDVQYRQCARGYPKRHSFRPHSVRNKRIRLNGILIILFRLYIFCIFFLTFKKYNCY